MFRTTILAAVAVAALLLTAAGEARAQTAQQYLQQAQQYESLAAYYERQGDRTTASRYRQAAQLYRQLAAQVAGSTPKPTPQPQPKPQPPQPSLQQQIMQKAAQSREAALNALRTRRPGSNGGYYVYYRRPPIYAGQSYSAEVGPYRFKSYEAVREITRLTNNGNVITQIGSW